MNPLSRPALLALLILLPVTTQAARAQNADAPRPPYPLHVLAWAPDTKAHALSTNTPADTSYKPYDPWFGWDKVKHFTFSFLFTVGGQYALVNKADMREHDALPISMGVSGVIGIGKELSDRARGRPEDFSTRDLVADAAGILLAAGFILL